MSVTTVGRGLLYAACLSLMSASSLPAADYAHTLTVDKMTFAWKVDGANLAVKLAAPTTGWVGIGFNPTDVMKDANIIIGYVKDGKVEIADEFGTQVTQHAADAKKGGQDNVTVIGGSETGNTTTLEFSIPLDSGDAMDRVIDPAADTIVLLAFGPGMDSFKMKHQYYKTITVNLGSGAMK
jgi:DOMON domain